MIPAKSFNAKTVAVFGLGGSGLAAAIALQAGGAQVVAWDDREEGRKRARAEGVEVADLREVDWHTLDALVLSPGVPLTHPEPHWTVHKAHKFGVAVIGDTELFFREKENLTTGARIIAITGTNGKSTTTALIAHLLQHAGFAVEMGGNIGRPVMDLAPFSDELVYVIELSSYQIDLTPTLVPDVAILLNISPDHLDRHGNLKNYARIKGQIFAQLHDDALAVIGVDDEICSRISTIVEGPFKTVRVSNSKVLDDGITAEDNKLYKMSGGHPGHGMSLAGCPALRGRHNWQNAAAACAVGQYFGLAREEILDGFVNFPGLAHRMEEVGRVGNILFINDSKATNAESAQHALSAFDEVYWIAGGRAKTGGIVELAPYFDHVTKAYLIGEAAKDFAKTLAAPTALLGGDGRRNEHGGEHGNAAVALEPERSVPIAHENCGTLEVAVAAAVRDAQTRPDEQTVILLSPACASFDQFKNFELRGDRFKELVAALPNVELTRKLDPTM